MTAEAEPLRRRSLDAAPASAVARATTAAGAPRAAGRRAGSAGPERVDERVLDRARGPVLDVGCGPGRHVHALARRGVLGARRRRLPGRGRAGARPRRRDGARRRRSSIALPGTGSWSSALLLDGNIGIGGSPDALLRRLAGLLAPGGAVLVELDPPGVGVARERVRLEDGARASEWFAWARVGADAVAGPARRGGSARAGALARRRALLRGAAGAMRAPPGPDARRASGAARCAGRGSRRRSARCCCRSCSSSGRPGFLSQRRLPARTSDATPCSRRAACSRSRFGWPASPSWLYAVNQGIHVTVGIITVPLLLAKLWSVTRGCSRGRRCATPRTRSSACAPGARRRRDLRVRHRASSTSSSTTRGTSTSSWRTTTAGWSSSRRSCCTSRSSCRSMLRAYRERGVLAPLRVDLERTRAEPHEPGGSRRRRRRRRRISRRGLFGLVAGAAAGTLRGDGRAVDRRSAARAGAPRAARHRAAALPDQQDRRRRPDHAGDGRARATG